MLDIQKFGSNDTVTASNTLALGFKRSDSTIQYIKLSNPQDELNESEVKSAMMYLTSNGLLLDSKAGTVLSDSAIFTAYTEARTTRDLDLT